jgi:hypothetical protein
LTDEIMQSGHVAARVIVENPDSVFLEDQAPHQSASNETGAAGYQIGFLHGAI